MAKVKVVKKEKIVPKKKKEESEDEVEEEEEDEEVLDLAGSDEEEEEESGEGEEEEDEDEEGEDEEMEEGEDKEEGEREEEGQGEEEGEQEDGEKEEDELELEEEGKKKKKKGVLKTDVDPEAKQKKTGVIYFSTIPNRFTQTRMRTELSKYGSIGRIFLQPEKKRGAGGKKTKKYTEGWVEFHSKGVAKRVAATLNASEVAVNRRSAAAGTFWNCKYLPGFKWIHLNEQLMYERKLERARMTSELNQAKRVAEHFTEQIEKGKHLRKLEEKVLKKQGVWEEFQRQIKQRSIVRAEKSKKKEEKSKGAKTDDALMSMIFNE